MAQGCTSPLPLFRPVQLDKPLTGVSTRPASLRVVKHLDCWPDRPEQITEGSCSPPPPIGRAEEIKRKRIYTYGQTGTTSFTAEDSLDSLAFDAEFESGNLQWADRVWYATGRSDEQFYELRMTPDINSNGHRQWFYFEVRNTQPHIKYTFSIVNFVKSSSLYTKGQQPVFYSRINESTKGEGWTHGGTSVCYYPSLPTRAPGSECTASLTSPPSSPEKQSGKNFTLTFCFAFPHKNDTCYFASLYPYTYSDLRLYIKSLMEEPGRSLIVKKTVLCRTLAGNTCDLLTITAPASCEPPYDERKVIILSARVHPGETNSSWAMKGAIDFLTGSSPEAEVLRKFIIFKVIPMLNPDGVINGNCRVSLAGVDLNRKWDSPVQKLYPTIYGTKQIIATAQVQDRALAFCDFHGHSINKNIFMYGCKTESEDGHPARIEAHDHFDGGTISESSTVRKTAVPSELGDLKSRPAKSSNKAKVKKKRKSHLRPRLRGASLKDSHVLPYVMSKHVPFFSYDGCGFEISNNKLGTGRVVVFQELNLINSFTLEISFCGATRKVARTNPGLHNALREGYQSTSQYCCDAASGCSQQSHKSSENLPIQKGSNAASGSPENTLRETHFSIGDLQLIGAEWCRSLLTYCHVVGQIDPEHLATKYRNQDSTNAGADTVVDSPRDICRSRRRSMRPGSVSAKDDRASVCTRRENLQLDHKQRGATDGPANSDHDNCVKASGRFPSRINLESLHQMGDMDPAFPSNGALHRSNQEGAIRPSKVSSKKMKSRVSSRALQIEKSGHAYDSRKRSVHTSLLRRKLPQLPVENRAQVHKDRQTTYDSDDLHFTGQGTHTRPKNPLTYFGPRRKLP